MPYKFATGITEIIDSGVELEEIYYDPSAFERKWTNETTNRLMMAEFNRLAHENYLELAPRQTIAPGKSIVFALTKNHAARLARYLNELHPECRGNYAAVITSDVANADDLIRQFKYENYPQIAVSVDMLNTGFNCREVLHLVMCRPIRSPILYQQIRGRGTRTAPHIDKQMFVIYDFFGNHEYFNDSDTDIFIGTTKGRSSSGSSKVRSSSPRELIELGVSDRWLQAVSYVEVGTEGERVDKQDYVSNWEETINNVVKDNLILQKIRRGELLTEEEENFRAWLVSKCFSTEQASYLSLLKNRAISQGKISIEDLFKPPLSVLNAAGLGLELFGEEGLKTIFDELNNSVFVDNSTGTDG